MTEERTNKTEVSIYTMERASGFKGVQNSQPAGVIYLHSERHSILCNSILEELDNLCTLNGQQVPSHAEIL